MIKIKVLIVVCCTILTAGLVHAAPKLVVDQVNYDFGSVSQGERVLHTFKFTNAGDEPLLISKVRSSCGCTAALLSAKHLDPGEQGELQANFDSARFRGSVSKKIYLYSNDPLVPVKPLQIKGQVLELFNLSPRQVNFGAVEAGETFEQQVTLKNQTEEPLLIAAVETTTPQLRAHFDEQLPAGGASEVRVALKVKPGQKRFSGYVIFKIQGERMYDLRLPVYATIN